MQKHGVVTIASGFIGSAVIETLALRFILGASIGGRSTTWELPRDLRLLETKAKAMTGRDAAMVNGALIARGLLGIVDNVVFRWMLELHRAVPGPHALTVEVVLMIISIGLFSLGIWQEARYRC